MERKGKRRTSRKDIGRFLGLDQKRNGTEVTCTNQMENGTMSLILWCLISVKVDILFFVDPVLGKLSMHFCGDEDTAEVVLRTIISVNQFAVYGAVADTCDELA